MKRAVVTLLALLLPPVAAASAQEVKVSPALASLVEAERAFARAGVEKGVRASFLEYFAEDGISFAPGPGNARERLLKRPAPPARPPVTLNWWPVVADVSRDGGLGYTSGPSRFSDDTGKEPPRDGYYFSVWKKQPDGAWKVALDVGTKTIAPAGPEAAHVFTPAAQAGWKAPKVRDARPQVLREALLTLEREFARDAAASGAAKAYARRLAGGARLHRDDATPFVGAAAINSFLSAKISRLAWQPLGADVSASADLGYTYGSYELAPAGGAAAETERGYYAHVWKRDPKGDWKLVMEVHHPAPPEQN